jgi:hypothetical protein
MVERGLHGVKDAGASGRRRMGNSTAFTARGEVGVRGHEPKPTAELKPPNRAQGSPALRAFVSVAREVVAEWKQEAREVS